MLTNDEIQKNVLAEIMWEPELRDVLSQIQVSVANGIVVLSGSVDTYRKKCSAENAALHVRGIKVISTDLKVTIDESIKKGDSEIIKAIEHALSWNSAINEDKIKVNVEDGWVSFLGEVEWNFQKNIIEKCAESLNGVRGINNDITIKPKDMDLSEIQKKITAAFQLGASIDAISIKLEQVDDKIILKGTVRSLAEKKDAERIAWTCPIVRSVENRITVDPGIVL